MTRHVVALYSKADRERAVRLIAAAPSGAVVEVKAAKRTIPQNKLFWSILTEVSIAKPQGRCHTPEVWKHLFMSACGHAVQFETGLDGNPFPIGFRSSKLSKSQMAELIEFIYAWGAENGVIFSEDKEVAA